MKILILTRYGSLGASSRMRFFQYFPFLEKDNISFVVSALISNEQLSSLYNENKYSLWGLSKLYLKRIKIIFLKNNFDLLWIEKEALPWFPFWIERTLLGKLPYVLDYDDAIFHNYDQHRIGFVRYFWGQRVDQLMKNATLVVAGNHYLAQRADKAGCYRVEIIPTVIDLNRYPVKQAKLKNPEEVLRIVWIGSSSTIKFLKLVEKPLAKLSRKFSFKLRIIASDYIYLKGVNVEFIPWSNLTEVTSIQECDIGIMPLTDTSWERGKCGYKLIQYMACGLPIVASPVGVNCDIVNIGENGYLSKTNDEWINNLGLLLKNNVLREKMGANGRRQVEEKYSLQNIAPKITRLLYQAQGVT